MMLYEANFITADLQGRDICPVFRRQFSFGRKVSQAELEISSLGVYLAELNGMRVGDFVLAPGWTSYRKRLQVQTYDVTELLRAENELLVTVGKGWFRSPLPGFKESDDKRRRSRQPAGLIAALKVSFEDGSRCVILTDEEWEYSQSAVLFSELYDGEKYDARVQAKEWKRARLLEWNKEILIPQEGEAIREQARVAARRIFRTPSGELVVDFGQEITGYVEFTVDADAGDRVRFDHGEVLDQNGNFYNANYRSAKSEVDYICSQGKQTYHPVFTFFGFRYIRLLEFPGEPGPEQFSAIVVHSDLKRTGRLVSADALLNRFFSNVEWGQRGNFLDVPTDCPQRDERLGWTGDAQVFVKAASYQFDVERFFRKWLRDLSADQRVNGEVGQVIPDVMPDDEGSAGWGDAALICPWQIYQTYGDRCVLEEQFESMKAWIDFISGVTKKEDLWTGHFHFGDWLGLDAPLGSYKGSSREDFIASAFYAYSTSLLVKAGHVTGKDVSEYEALHGRIVRAFRKEFPTCKTQTEHVLAVQFGLAKDPQRTADDLAEMIKTDGNQLRTGFIGTPYLLHVLSDYGHADLAWKLLLRREYPGWLYSVKQGATTVWEHWDGIREDGSFWSDDMNSFNHYSYGAVIDWVYEKAAGICHDEDSAGFSRLHFEPHPEEAAGYLRAELETRNGKIVSAWGKENGHWRIELETPVSADVVLPSVRKTVTPGKYIFWETGNTPEIS